jgi:hypothetical protein
VVVDRGCRRIRRRPAGRIGEAGTTTELRAGQHQPPARTEQQLLLSLRERGSESGVVEAVAAAAFLAVLLLQLLELALHLPISFDLLCCL